VIRDVISEGEAFLKTRTEHNDRFDYWELSTGFSLNLNPLFSFRDGRWKVRWGNHGRALLISGYYDAWRDVAEVAPPSGKGEAETNQILMKLRELNAKLAPKIARLAAGEEYLNSKLGVRDVVNEYWELSTGFSFNLNPQFQFVDDKWVVRWSRSDPWRNVDEVTPPWGKGEEETKEILKKLTEINDLPLK